MKNSHASALGRLSTLVFVLVLCGATASFGAWGGQLDGNQHPMVGAVYGDINRNGRIQWFERLCTGSYAGPSRDGTGEVFLTAGHLIPFAARLGVTQFWVSFDSDARDGVGAPEGLIAVSSVALDPRFGHDLGNLYDSAVLMLPPGSAAGIEPVELPRAGYLDELKESGELQHMVMEVVGYGVVPDWQEPGGTVFFYDGRRRSSSSQVKALTPAFVYFNQNTEATDLGGLCFGDSGSPQFVPGTRTIVSTTTGGDMNCRANNRNYRMDTPGAREFLGEFLNLP